MRRQLDPAGAWYRSHGAPGGAKRWPAAAAGCRRAATTAAGSPARPGTARRATPRSPSHATCAQHTLPYSMRVYFQNPSRVWQLGLRIHIHLMRIRPNWIAEKQSCGSGSSISRECGLRIRDPSINKQKKMKKNLDFYCFVISLGLFIFGEWCKCTLQKGISKKT